MGANILMSTLFERLKTLANIDAIPGQEQPMVEHLVKVLTPLCDKVEVDKVGNVYATKHSGSEGPVFMIAAHTDEIGLIVKSVEDTGFLRFEKVGGVLDNLLASRLVRVAGQLGVIGMKAGHYQTPEERRQVKPHTDMYIDIGARSAKEVAQRGIEIGDAITFVSDVVEIGDDRPLVAGKAIDNRLGCAVLWQLLEEAKPTAGTLIAVFTSQEEVGLKGASIAGYRVQPTLGIALDTMPSGDTPDMDFTKQLNVALGGGPCLQVLAGQGGKGFLLNRPVKKFIRTLAAQANVPLQLNTFTGGNNDAATIAWSGLGVPAASLCLPRRYSHSPLEVADLDDAKMTLALLHAVTNYMDRFPSFDFLPEN